MEERNESQEQEKDIVEKGAEKAKQQVGNIAKNAGKNIAKKVAAVVAKLVIIIFIKLLPIILVATIFIAVSDWFLDVFSLGEVAKAAENMSEEYCIVDSSGIRFNGEALKLEIEEQLKNGGIEKDDLGLGDDDDKASEYLYNFMAASLRTQLPYIAGSDKEAQGNIYFKRDINDDKKIDDGEILTYIGYEEFTTRLNAADSSLRAYFSIDESWNICISKAYESISNEDTTEYALTEEKIPYKRMIMQYSMPFEFLMTLQLITINAEYVQAVADLSNEVGRIDVTIFDQIETTTTTYTYKATRNTKTTTPAHTIELEDGTEKEVEAKTSTSSQEIDGPPEVTVRNINAIIANVTSVQNWILQQSTDYEFEHILVSDETEIIDLGSDEEPSGDGSWDTNKSETYQVVVEKDIWQAQPSVSKLTPSEFLGLWMNKDGEYKKGAKYDPDGIEVLYNRAGEKEETKPTDMVVTNITTSEEQLYGHLEEREYTQLQAELMKYLIDLYKSGEPIDEYAEEFDLSIFEPDPFESAGFTSSSMGGMGGTIGSTMSYGSLTLTGEDLEILYKITSAERGGGTQKQQEYVVSVILNRVLSSGFPNTVRGVVFAPNQFQPTRNGAYEKANPSAVTKAAVDNVIANGDTTGGALYFMTPGSVAGQWSWLKNCKFLFNDSDSNITSPGTGKSGTHDFFTEPSKYEELKQYLTDKTDGKFVEVAKQCHDFLKNNNYFYSSASNKTRGGPPSGWENGANDGSSTGRTVPVPTNMLESASKRYIDCSGYVTWVIMEAGYIENKNMWQYDSLTIYNNKMGFQAVSLSDLQPGDILVRYASGGRSYRNICRRW